MPLRNAATAATLSDFLSNHDIGQFRYRNATAATDPFLIPCCREIRVILPFHLHFHLKRPLQLRYLWTFCKWNVPLVERSERETENGDAEPLFVKTLRPTNTTRNFSTLSGCCLSLLSWQTCSFSSHVCFLCFYLTISLMTSSVQAGLAQNLKPWTLNDEGTSSRRASLKN